MVVEQALGEESSAMRLSRFTIELIRNAPPVSVGTSTGRQTRRDAGKIVLVSQHYAPFPSTTSGYMTDIAESTRARKPGHRDVELALLGLQARRSKPGEPEVIEIRSWWPEKSALVSRSFAAALFAVQVFIAVMKHTRSEDVLLCVTTPFTRPIRSPWRRGSARPPRP